MGEEKTTFFECFWCV